MRKICVLRGLTDPAGESQSRPQGHCRLSPALLAAATRVAEMEVKTYLTAPLPVLGAQAVRDCSLLGPLA